MHARRAEFIKCNAIPCALARTQYASKLIRHRRTAKEKSWKKFVQKYTHSINVSCTSQVTESRTPCVCSSANESPMKCRSTCPQGTLCSYRIRRATRQNIYPNHAPMGRRSPFESPHQSPATEHIWFWITRAIYTHLDIARSAYMEGPLLPLCAQCLYIHKVSCGCRWSVNGARWGKLITTHYVGIKQIHAALLCPIKQHRVHLSNIFTLNGEPHGEFTNWYRARLRRSRLFCVSRQRFGCDLN